MKNFFIVLLFLLPAGSTFAKCTPAEFENEYIEFSHARSEYLNEKKDKLDSLLSQIKEKKQLSDKEIYDYRISLLSDESTLKLKAKEPSFNIMDFIDLKRDLKCGKLMKYHNSFKKYADKQWAIIFELATKELNNT